MGCERSPCSPSSRTIWNSSQLHIDDSTSEGLTSANYLPNPSDRGEAQYARVGAPARTSRSPERRAGALVNVKSLVPSGPYAESNMLECDEALLDLCPRYPNMRVYDWASDVKDAWFIEDGITSPPPATAPAPA